MSCRQSHNFLNLKSYFQVINISRQKCLNSKKYIEQKKKVEDIPYKQNNISNKLNFQILEHSDLDILINKIPIHFLMIHLINPHLQRSRDKCYFLHSSNNYYQVYYLDMFCKLNDNWDKSDFHYLHRILIHNRKYHTQLKVEVYERQNMKDKECNLLYSVQDISGS